MQYPFSPYLHSVIKRLNTRFNADGEFNYDNPGEFESLDRVASFCHLYGHNLCHLLTMTLFDYTKGNADIIEFVGVDSKNTYHSCVLIDDRYVFNAYGMMTLGDAKEYYKNLSSVIRPPHGETITHQTLRLDKLKGLIYNPNNLSPDNILNAFHSVLNFTTLTMQDLSYRTSPVSA